MGLLREREQAEVAELAKGREDWTGDWVADFPQSQMLKAGKHVWEL